MFRLEKLDAALGGRVLDVLTGNSVVPISAVYNKLNEAADPTPETLEASERWLGAFEEFRDAVGDQAWHNAPMHQALYGKLVYIHDVALSKFLARQRRAQRKLKRAQEDSDGEWLPRRLRPVNPAQASPGIATPYPRESH